MELKGGSNIMILSSLYIAASHTAHVLYIFYVYMYTVLSVLDMYYFREHVTSILFSLRK